MFRVYSSSRMKMKKENKNLKILKEKYLNEKNSDVLMNLNRNRSNGADKAARFSFFLRNFPYYSHKLIL